MQGSHSPAPIVAFVAFLRENRRIRERIDWPALEQSLAGGRHRYQDLWEAGVLPGDALADAIADFHRLPRVDAEAVADRGELLGGLSRRFLRDAWMFPFLDRGAPALAVADPTRDESIRAVAVALGRLPDLRIAAFDEVGHFFEREGGADGGLRPAAAASPGVDDVGAEESLERLQDLASGAPVVHAVDGMLETALNLGATDIHIEPERDGVRLRMRVDGLLRPIQTLPAAMARAVVSRVKILAGLNIAERRLPQDGRTRMRIGTVEADLRIATMPTLHGESVVLRLLVKDAQALDLGRLGMSAHDLAIFTETLAEPHGLVVVSGPTGSGKTTTLAAALTLLNRPECKIMTIEDPIEYQVPGVHQTQVKPSIDLTFANALRSLLRHDPDILMVGEMRDRDTATIGIQSALTGHLVLTTLHTNNAADAVVRLLDLGVENFLLVSALRCVVAQRLVRRLCERCRRPSTDLPEAAESLAQKGLFAPHAGEVYFSPVGCGWCGRTGYRGRIGIFEVLRLDDRLRGLVRRHVDVREIHRQARAAGMTTMLEDGITKFRSGITSIEEVRRATS